MRRLISKDTGPPEDTEGHSFRYLHPETGHTSFARDWWTWGSKIREHREGNNLPIPDNMMAIAEDQLCGSIPPERCIYEVGDKPPVNVQGLSLAKVKSWVIAIANRALAGAPMVDKSEAERRAAICVSCPYNIVPESGCGSCQQKLVEMLTPGIRARSTSQDERLKSCAVCGCWNRVAVWFPLDILQKSATPEQLNSYPDFCWRVNG